MRVERDLHARLSSFEGSPISLIQSSGIIVFCDSTPLKGRINGSGVPISTAPNNSALGRRLSKMSNLLVLILFLALVIDVSYGVVTYNTPYGCTTALVQVTQPPQTSQPRPSQINWQVLAEPCFYIYYFGIVGGSILVISLIPASAKPRLGNKS